MVEFRSEDIEIEIQDAIFCWMVVHMSIDLVLVLYADHGSDESRIDRGLYVVADIAGVIHELIGIDWISDGSIEIERVIIVPEVGVLIDMDELTSSLDDSISGCLDPRVEDVVVVVDDRHGDITVSHPYKLLESDAGSEYPIIDLLEYDMCPDAYIIERTIDHGGDRERRDSSMSLPAYLSGKYIVADRFRESIDVGVGEWHDSWEDRLYSSLDTIDRLDHGVKYLIWCTMSGIDHDIIESHIIDMEIVILHIAIILTLASYHDIFCGMFDGFMTLD